jgi:hypothetical protein
MRVAVMSLLNPPWAWCCTRPGRQGSGVGSRAVDVQVRRPAGPRCAMSRLGGSLGSVDAFHLSNVQCECVAASAGRKSLGFGRPSGRSKLVVRPPRAGAGLGAQKPADPEGSQGARGRGGDVEGRCGPPPVPLRTGAASPAHSLPPLTHHRPAGAQVLRGPARTSRTWGHSCGSRRAHPWMHAAWSTRDAGCGGRELGGGCENSRQSTPAHTPRAHTHTHPAHRPIRRAPSAPAPAKRTPAACCRLSQRRCMPLLAPSRSRRYPLRWVPPPRIGVPAVGAGLRAFAIAVAIHLRHAGIRATRRRCRGELAGEGV